MTDLKKRIIALTEKLTLAAGDFIAVDNASGGTKKYALTEATSSKAGLMAAADKAALDGAVEDVADLKSELNNFNSVTQGNKNQYDKTTLTTGKYVNSSGTLTSKANFYATDYIPICKGDIILLSYTLGSNTYCLSYYDVGKAFLSSSPLNKSDSLFVAPDNACYVRITVSSTYYDNAEIYIIPAFQYNANYLDNYQLEPRGLTINGKQHNGFPAITNFNGAEIIAVRSAPAHATGATTGGITLFKRSKDGTVNNVKYIDSGAWTGELRDPSLSVSRDGQYLFLSCFTTYNSTSHDNVIIALNGTLDIVDTYVDSNTDTIFWGKTFETSTGKLLHCGYKAGTGVYLYTSSGSFNGSNFNNITFTSSLVISASNATESDIGSTDKYLYIVARRETTSSVYIKTTDLDGQTGWDSPHSMGLLVHAPKVLAYSPTTNYMIFVGALYVSSSVRKPAVALYRMNDNTIIEYAILEDASDYAGYIDMTRVCDFIYDFVWYNEISVTTKVNLQRINLRDLLPAINFIF